MPKILITRFSSIGDIVLTTPAIRCLKKQLPDAEIHYCTKKQFAPLLQANPYIDKLHLLEDGLKPLIKELKKEHFDFIADLHNNFRTFLIKRALKAKKRTLNKLNFRKWLLVRFKINTMPDVHIVDRYLKTVEPLGVKNDGEGLDYFIPEGEEVAVQDIPKTHQQGYIAFVIGAKHATKRLPVQKIISICDQINYPIILLGSNEERQQGQKIVEAVGETIYNACGLYTLNQSASLVKKAKKVITHDTGLMHIAAAFQKDILSIWGNTVPELGMYPYLQKPARPAYLTEAPDKYRPDSYREAKQAGGSEIAEVKGLSCRPCSKLGYGKCPKGHFKCMLEQNEEQIVRWANS